MALHWADVGILALIAVSAVLSLFRGLIREVVALLGWVVAGWVSLKFSPVLAAHFAQFLSVPSLRLAIAFVVLLVGTLVPFGVLNLLLGRLIASTGLGGTDRMLGVVFGIVRGAAIVTLLVMLAGLTPFPRDPWWKGSRLLAEFTRLARLAIAQLPPEFADHFDYDTGQPTQRRVPPPS
jgi:membrane protein required for colicin V production